MLRIRILKLDTMYLYLQLLGQMKQSSASAQDFEASLVSMVKSPNGDTYASLEAAMSFFQT